MDERSTEVLPLVQVSTSGSSEAKLTLNSKNLTSVLENVEDLPVVVINVAGPRCGGKSLLFGYLVRRLEAAEVDEFDWLDSGNPEKPMNEFEWQNGGQSPEKPGIWSFNRPFILTVGEGSKRNRIAVLLLYTQSSSKTFWDVESTDVGALMGLSLLISSTTIFNVFKNLNEQVLSAVGNYVKYAVHGMSKTASPRKGKSPPAPFQNATFLVRDWNFPTEYSYGMSGGKRFIESEKLKDKPGHSKISRQTRQLIKGLFQNVSGCLLPFPGNNVITPDDFTGSIGEMEAKFSKHFTDFVSSVVNVDQLPIKKDASGVAITGQGLKDLMEGYIGRVKEADVSQLSPVSILRRFRIKMDIHPGEQKEHVKTALKVYSEVWKKYERGNKFFEERELKDIHRRAKNRTLEAFEKEIKPDGGEEDDDDDDDDDDEMASNKIDGNVKKLLMDKIVKRFEEMREENGKRKKSYLEQCKNDLLQQYRESMLATFPEGDRAPSKEYARRESKDVMTTLSGEYLEKMGTNGDRESMEDEQEEDMNNFMDRLAEEEKTFLDNLFGTGDVEQEDNDSDDGIMR